MNIWQIVIFILIAGTLITAGCTAFNGAHTPSPTESDSVFHESTSKNGDLTGWSNSGSGNTFPTPNPAYRTAENERSISTSSEQKIIKTADLTLEVINVSVSTYMIQSYASKSGGIVQSSSINAIKPDRYSGSITIRVPAERFDSVLPEIMSLGKVLSSSIEAEDVTEEYVDLKAQKIALSNQLNQYNLIMEKAQNISDILEVQKEIERVMVELDRITGKIKYLENRVAFATITISLHDPPQVVTPAGYSFAEVITDGIAGFVDTLVMIFIWVLTFLPLVIICAVGYLAYRRWKKSKTL